MFTLLLTFRLKEKHAEFKAVSYFMSPRHSLEFGQRRWQRPWDSEEGGVGTTSSASRVFLREWGGFDGAVLSWRVHADDPGTPHCLLNT